MTTLSDNPELKAVPNLIKIGYTEQIEQATILMQETDVGPRRFTQTLAIGALTRKTPASV